MMMSPLTFKEIFAATIEVGIVSLAVCHLVLDACFQYCEFIISVVRW